MAELIRSIGLPLVAEMNPRERHALDLPLDVPRDENLDPQPREDDLLYSNVLLGVLLVLSLPFLGGLA